MNKIEYFLFSWFNSTNSKNFEDEKRKEIKSKSKNKFKSNQFSEIVLNWVPSNFYFRWTIGRCFVVRDTLENMAQYIN